MEINRDQIFVARAVKWAADTVTLEIPFRSDYAFRLSENPAENQFFTLVFVRLKDGHLVVDDPFMVERLAAPTPDAKEAHDGE